MCVRGAAAGRVVALIGFVAPWWATGPIDCADSGRYSLQALAGVGAAVIVLSLEAFEALLRGGSQLCFVHIPKTAGSTFVEHFRRYAPDCASFWYSAGQREAFRTAGALDAECTARLCGGHFGVHDFLERCADDAVLLSFVRHPVERLVSYYLFARRSGAGHETAAAARELELFDFLQYLEAHRPRILFNQQCRFLAASADLAQEIGIRFEDVQSGWKGLDLFLAQSSACREITQRVADATPAPEPGTIQDRKVTRERPVDVLDDRTARYIQETNAEDVKLFNMDGIYAAAG